MKIDLLVDKSSSNRLGHSWRNRFAPVREPSPPMTTRLVIPRSTKFLAAFRRPGLSRKSAHRAEPITVPPWESMLNVNSEMNSIEKKCHHLKSHFQSGHEYFGGEDVCYCTSTKKGHCLCPSDPPHLSPLPTLLYLQDTCQQLKITSHQLFNYCDRGYYLVWSRKNNFLLLRTVKKGLDHFTCPMDNWWYRWPVGLLNIATSINHSLVAFFNKENFAAKVNSHSYNSSDSSIHTCQHQESHFNKWQ